MNGRPTTDQLVEQCRRALLDDLAPSLTEPAHQVAVQMIDHIMKNIAARCRVEIAWMVDEIASMTAFARSTLTAHPDAQALHESIVHFEASPKSDSLELDDVCERYSRASGALSQAIEVAQQADDRVAVDRAVALLRDRNAREQELMCDWQPVGRG